MLDEDTEDEVKCCWSVLEVGIEVGIGLRFGFGTRRLRGRSASSSMSMPSGRGSGGSEISRSGERTCSRIATGGAGDTGGGPRGG